MSSTGLCTDYTSITELRATDPGAIARAWHHRKTRPAVRGNGRLMIVAADHPARGALGVGDRPTAMNSRTDLLERLRAALADRASMVCLPPPTSSTTCCCWAPWRTRWCSRR